ncbi:MAG: ATP-binding protein [Candidatus Bipolaricaulia bacterium]
MAEMASSVSRREFLRAPWKSLVEGEGTITVDPQRCTLCGACVDRCPEGALALAGAPECLQLVFDATRCTGCETCLICPEKALHLEKIIEPERQLPTLVILVEDQMLRCSRCGQELGPARLVAKILKSPQELLCPTCRLVKGIPLPYSAPNGHSQPHLASSGAARAALGAPHERAADTARSSLTR